METNSPKHIMFENNKMKVNLAVQTLSSSVADAIEYLQELEHPSFKDASGTVKFIRIVDRFFDLFNSRNPKGKGFKAPLRHTNKNLWVHIIDHTITYLSSLKDVNGLPLLRHRRNTFVKGMITTAKSVEKLALELLFRETNPYKYILTYKISQDHVELLNSSIRGRNGRNNNPNVMQFKSAMKRVLLRASLTASRYANCLSFDPDTSPPIFSLKYTKNRSALVQEDAGDSVDLDLSLLDNPLVMSEPLMGTLAYIGGCLVRSLSKEIDCQTCCAALLTKDKRMHHLSLIALKDNGGLVYPSDDIVRIVKVCEKYFKVYVRGHGAKGINASRNLMGKLQLGIITELSQTRPDSILFKDLLQHDVDTHVATEDLHSTQIMKEVVSKFLKMRLLRYGQEFTQKMIMQKKGFGKRQRLNKLTLFDGL